MTDNERASQIESDQRAALIAAIQVGADDIRDGHFDNVDNPMVWVNSVEKTTTQQSVA
ncbi:hypothetical protein [Microcella sp.]|uniref:hypothetical protein n=1 Tax=Microcella sp. TaxID=1913979 RepID=UPI00299F6407|nr:hypothetical protein [Microcella sp.]MDX2026732.1 hypothetical protein [Microcella sp.]